MRAPRVLKEGVRLAATFQSEIADAGLATPAPNLDALYEAMVTHARLRKTTLRLFRDRHFAQAVEEAYKLVCNRVKERVPGTGRDGMDLMLTVFNERSPQLKLNALQSESDESEQRGYKFLFAGGMAGVRNPRAHHHEYEEHPETALELLILANHLLRKVDGAT